MINKNHLKEEEIVLSSEPLEEKENAEIEKTEEVSAKTEEKKEAFRVSEIQELREANKKVFRMSDGTEQAVFYPRAVHIFDEETNSFEDIDNTLIESRDQNTIVNGKGNFTVEFSEDETNNELFSISEGAHRITFSLNNNSMCIPKPIKKSDETSGKDKIVFEDIYSGTDFEYYVTETGIRENIVIKESANKYSFSFRIHCENVNGNMNNSNKRISFVSNDTGEEILYIWPSQMHDAYGDISDDDLLLSIFIDHVNFKIWFIQKRKKHFVYGERERLVLVSLTVILFLLAIYVPIYRTIQI